jgi:hypothetical protein
MKLTENRLERVEKVVGYRCDICGDDIELAMFETVSSVKHTYPTGSYGEAKTELIEVCSWACLVEGIKRVNYGADIYINSRVVKEV